MYLHELLHEPRIKKQHGVVFKIVFEKTYDKLNLNFLVKCLELSGFSEIWCGWMKNEVVGGSLCVRINNTLGVILELSRV
jgi:hypothetical protein